MAYCPRSSLPATVLDWLARRLAHLAPPRPPGQGGTLPLSLEVRLDAVGSVLLDGLSYRRAGRAVGISKTEVGDSLDLLLGELAALGFCQPDGSFITSLDQLRRWLAEMATSGEAVLVDGLGTRVQRPRTRRCSTTPSGTPTPPKAWRWPPSTATCCGWMAAGRAAATSRSSSSWQAGVDPVSRTPRELAARPSKGGSGWHASTQPSSAVTRSRWCAAATRPSPRLPMSSASTARRCASGSSRTASTRAKPRG